MKDKRFSTRTGWPLSSNSLMETFKRLNAKSIAVIDLTESNPTRCDFRYPQRVILEALLDGENLKYLPDPRGMPKAREAISRYYENRNIQVDPQQIFITSSASEAYSYIFRLLANSGEKFLFPRPSYPLFQFLADLNDVGMDYYTLFYDRSWKIDFDRLTNGINPLTKAIVLVNPNNPTGSFIHGNDLKELNQICRAGNLALIADEVFWDFARNHQNGRVSLAANKEVLTFSLGGISKALGLPQMKLSWIVVNGPRALIDQAMQRLEIIADTYLSVNTPVQNALNQWLSLTDAIQAEINERIQNNLNFVQAEVIRAGHCKILNMEGGWYAVLKIPDTRSEEDWCLDFLNKDHVLAYPGCFFDFENEPFLVLSLLPPEKVFQDGIVRILESTKRLIG